MNHFAVHASLLAYLGVAGVLSAVVISEEALKANKPQLKVSKNGNTLTIDWETQPEVYYFMEGSPDLDTWIPKKLIKDIGETGSLTLETDIISSKAFYRLSLEGDPNSARLRADDDGDKIINILEANKGWDHLVTPNFVDNDNDGIPDYWEDFHFETLDHDGTYVATPGGLTMAEAFAAGTDPKQIDSDGDGLPDAVDPKPNYNQTRDNPSGDDDEDGLTNREENDIYGTFPLNSNSDGDIEGVKDGDDAWPHDPNLNHKRTSESYALIDLSDELPYPSSTYSDLRIHIDDTGGTMLAYKTDAATPSASTKNFVTRYYNFVEVLEPTDFNGEKNVQYEAGDGVEDYIEYGLSLTQMLNRAGEISFEGTLGYNSINRPKETFMPAVRKLDLKYDVVTKQTSSVIPEANLNYVLSGLDFEYAYLNLSLYHSKYNADFVSLFTGMDAASVDYYSEYYNSEALNEFSISSLYFTDEIEENWEFKGLGSNGLGLYYIESNWAEFEVFNDGLALKSPGAENERERLEDAYGYSIISALGKDIVLRKNGSNGYAYSLDEGTTFNESKVWFSSSQSLVPVNFEGIASNDLVVVNGGESIIINGQLKSVTQLLGDQANGWSDFKLTDINSHSMIAGHALFTPTDGSRAQRRVFALLKVDLENQRGDLVSDSLLVSKFQTDVIFDDLPSPTGDPHTYRIKLPIEDLGSSTVSVKLETYIDGSIEDRNSSEDGVLTLTQKTENGETFYATENFRLVTWDSDDAYEGNRTLRVELNDMVRATLTIGGNDAGYIELPVGQEPTSASDFSYDAVRTVHVVFHKIGTNGTVPNVSDSDLDAAIEALNKTFAQGCIRFVKDDTTDKTWPPFQHLVIEGEAITSGSIEVGYGPEAITVNIAPGSAYSVAKAIETAINGASPSGNVEAVNTWPKLETTDELNIAPVAHLISLSSDYLVSDISKTGLNGLTVRTVYNGGGVSANTKDGFLAAAAYFHDRDDETLDVFIVGSVWSAIGTWGAALPADSLGLDSDIKNTLFMWADHMSSIDPISMYTLPHEVHHVIGDAKGHNYPSVHIGTGARQVGEKIDASKRINDADHTSYRSIPHVMPLLQHD